MLSTGGQSEQLRYERKFLITDHSYSEVEQMIKFHPACFSEIFHERNVNNIYFDTLGMTNYYDNLEGETERFKIRIRWYDNLFGHIQNPLLEYKIKKGLLGKKETYKLRSFQLDQSFSEVQIKKATDSIPPKIKNEIASLKPTLLNSYTRKYFLSADGNFRITIDHHLNYYRINYIGNIFVNRSLDHKTTVLELKYDSSLETEAKLVSNLFPFALTKSSKYLQGLQRVVI